MIKKETISETARLMKKRYEGCLVGGAVGDALGYPVEFMSEPEIFAQYGIGGICTLAQAGHPAVISDDTQMTLFVANAYVYHRKHIKSDWREIIHRAYREWYVTQTGDESLLVDGKPMLEIYSDPRLHKRRAPGNTCLSAIRSFIDEPKSGLAQNKSKGCGTVMRAAPYGLFFHYDPIASRGDSSHVVLKMAGYDARITHGHPDAESASIILAKIIFEIVQYHSEDPNKKLKNIILESLSSYSKEHCYCKAVELAEDHTVQDLDAIHQLGQGWVADEALAIAIFCALRYQNDFGKAIRAAVNHKGDSDSTGAICGNILGAWLGIDAVRESFDLNDLEMNDLILHSADELYNVVEVYHKLVKASSQITQGLKARNTHFWLNEFLKAFTEEAEKSGLQISEKELEESLFRLGYLTWEDNKVMYLGEKHRKGHSPFTTPKGFGNPDGYPALLPPELDGFRPHAEKILKDLFENESKKEPQCMAAPDQKPSEETRKTWESPEIVLDAKKMAQDQRSTFYRLPNGKHLVDIRDNENYQTGVYSLIEGTDRWKMDPGLTAEFAYDMPFGEYDAFLPDSVDHKLAMLAFVRSSIMIFQPEHYQYYACFQEDGAVQENTSGQNSRFLPKGGWKGLREQYMMPAFGMCRRMISFLKKEEALSATGRSAEGLANHSDSLNLTECLHFLLYSSRDGMRYSQRLFFKLWSEGKTRDVLMRTEKLLKEELFEIRETSEPVRMGNAYEKAEEERNRRKALFQKVMNYTKVKSGNELYEIAVKDSDSESGFDNLLNYSSILFDAKNCYYYVDFNNGVPVRKEAGPDLPEYLPWPHMLAEVIALNYSMMEVCLSLTPKGRAYLALPDLFDMEQRIDSLLMEECMQFFLFFNRALLRAGDKYFYERWSHGVPQRVVHRMQLLRKQ